MIVPAREVYVCRCATEVPLRPAAVPAEPARYRRGLESDVDRVDPRHHSDQHRADFRTRLARGEYWLLAEIEHQIVGYTWLHERSHARYPTLPGCEVELSPETGYGYDAWTSPEHRGHGLRRHGFVAELEVLRRRGLRWEASFFVSYQLERAQRSLRTVGIEVEPVWRVFLRRDRTLGAERLLDCDSVRPIFARAA